MNVAVECNGHVDDGKLVGANSVEVVAPLSFKVTELFSLQEPLFQLLVSQQHPDCLLELSVPSICLSPSSVKIVEPVLRPRQVNSHWFLHMLTYLFWGAAGRRRGAHPSALIKLLSFSTELKICEGQRVEGRVVTCPAEKAVRQEERPERGLVGV